MDVFSVFILIVWRQIGFVKVLIGFDSNVNFKLIVKI